MQLDFDGLMVEVHPHPADALTDAPQQLSPNALTALLGALRDNTHHNNIDTSGDVALLREKIDEVDRDLLTLLSRRMGLSRQMAEIKRQAGMSVYQPKRWEAVLTDRLQQAESLGLDQAFVQELLEKIHGESVRVQME